jgi:hypothetical protein
MSSLVIRSEGVEGVEGVKGSDVYSSTGDPRLDLSVKCVRGANQYELCVGMEAVLALKTKQALEDAFVIPFHTRNVRGGKGEREVAYTLFKKLYSEKPTLMASLLDLIPHYGCWDDLYRLATSSDDSFQNKVVQLTAKQLLEDDKTTGSISLCAKWAPRENRYKPLTRKLVDVLYPDAPFFSSRMKNYRQLVSRLNARLKTVETYMCAHRWDEIVPSTVPGRAGKLYNKAFLNLPSTYLSKKAPVEKALRCPDDTKRMVCRESFQAHFAKAVEGKAKIHGADTLFPHELVKKVANSTDLSEEEKNHIRGVWRSMVEKAKTNGGLGRSIFMSDFSGSMQSTSVGDTPYWVSMALGMLGAEVCSEEFKDKLMTFDSSPEWHTFLSGSDIFERVQTIQRSRIGQGTSTDFQKAMDLILATLKEKRIRPGQEPENLIVLTDMGWDQACSSAETSQYTGNRYRHVVKTAPWQTQIEMIQDAFRRAGEDMWGVGCGFTAPRIVIWNLAASYSSDHHAQADTPGVAMLSGWSPSQFEILQTEGPRQMTPYEILRIELDNPKYQRIRDRIRLFDQN